MPTTIRKVEGTVQTQLHSGSYVFARVYYQDRGAACMSLTSKKTSFIMKIIFTNSLR